MRSHRTFVSTPIELAVFRFGISSIPKLPHFTQRRIGPLHFHYFLNIPSIRFVTRNPPAMLMAAIRTAMAPRMTVRSSDDDVN